MRMIDITGQRFGRLLVLERVGLSKSRSARWLCRCDCGTEKTITSHSLRICGTKSCGCIQREIAHKMFTKHGMNRTPTYRVWEGIIQRCTNPKSPVYGYYGERGIRVCEPWLRFENFFADMGNKPSKLSIDRIDPNGNYEPGNCRWATRHDQARNRCNTHLYELNGQRKILTDWAAEFGVNRFTVAGRLRRGWDFHRALTQEAY